MVSPDEPNDKKYLILLIFAGILMTGLIVLAVTTYSGAPGPGKSEAPAVGTQVIPLTAQPREIITTGSTTLAVPSLTSTVVPVTTPARMVSPVPKSHVIPCYIRTTGCHGPPGYGGFRGFI